MRKSAALTVLFTHAHTRNPLPAPHTKADTLPRAQWSTGAASAIQCLQCRAGTGSRGWARHQERSRLLWQPSPWTAMLSWEGGLCHLTPQPSLLINQREVLWTTKQTQWRWICYRVHEEEPDVLPKHTRGAGAAIQNRKFPTLGPAHCLVPSNHKIFTGCLSRFLQTVCVWVCVLKDSNPLCYLHTRCT